jgi:hypothetical protein
MFPNLEKKLEQKQALDSLKTRESNDEENKIGKVVWERTNTERNHTAKPTSIKI